MPPLVYETAAWLRFYTRLPVPPLPGESDAGSIPDPARNAHAAPIAGALIGASGGIVIAIAAALGATDFIAVALGILALVLMTGGQAESALAASAGRRMKTQAVQSGIVAIVIVVLLRAGALDGLLLYGVWNTAFALVGACAVSRAAALGFVLMRPAAPEMGASPVGSNALQWLAIVGLAIGITAVLPIYGLGAAIAGIAAAAGAVAFVSSFLPRDAGETEREFTASAELLSEIAFLVAVLAFASH